MRVIYRIFTIIFRFFRKTLRNFGQNFQVFRQNQVFLLILKVRGIAHELELEISVFKVGIITSVAVFWTRFVMVKLLSFQLFTKNHIL